MPQYIDPASHLLASAKEEFLARLDIYLEDKEATDGAEDTPAVRYEIARELEQDLEADSHGAELLLRDLRRYLIACGTYREVTREELAATIQLRHGRSGPGRPDFRLAGKMYIFNAHPTF